MNKQVLWIDEEQGDLSSVAWTISRTGARVFAALSVAEARDAMHAGEWDAIILDAIVRRGGAADATDRYSGLAVWEAMTETQRDRTLVLSVVPQGRVCDRFKIPLSRVYWKLNLDAMLPQFEEHLRSIIEGHETVTP